MCGSARVPLNPLGFCASISRSDLDALSTKMVKAQSLGEKLRAELDECKLAASTAAAGAAKELQALAAKEEARDRAHEVIRAAGASVADAVVHADHVNHRQLCAFKLASHRPTCFKHVSQVQARCPCAVSERDVTVGS